ncbi:MAG: hypothetical protein U1F66_11690 [bacterium]
MAVARETLLSALESLKELEEFAVANLAEVGRYNFSEFPPTQRDKIRRLLQRLQEDSVHHEDMLEEIVARLRR